MQIDFIGHGLNQNNKINVGDQIATSLKGSHFESFIGFVAFSAISGVNKLLPFLKEAKTKYKKLVFFIGVDNKGTSKQSLEILLENEIETYIYHNNAEYITYHPKLFIFEGKIHSRIIIGSSNLTQSGFLSNIEASIQLDYRTETDSQGKKLTKEIKTYFAGIINLTDKNVFKLDADLIDKYDKLGLLYSQLKVGKTIERQSNDGENKEEKSIVIPFFENKFGEGNEPDNKLSKQIPNSVSQKDYENFNYFLEKYIIYKRDVKSTGAVNKNTDQIDLYNWYRRMKELIKEQIIPYEFASQLIDVGFPIDSAWEGLIRFVWDKNYKELLEFKENEQKHLDFTYVPNTKNKESKYYKLGIWCVRQKRRRKDLDTPKWDWKYEENKMKEINYSWEVPIGFNASASRSDRTWSDRLAELEKFYEDKSNFKKIPNQQTSLGRWFNDQLTIKINGTRGKKEKKFLNPIKEQKLGEILRKNNIEWEWQKQKERESIEEGLKLWQELKDWDKKPEKDKQNEKEKKKFSKVRGWVSQTKLRTKKWNNPKEKWKLEMLLKVEFPVSNEIE
jgi:HKD family nuclease